MKLLKQDVINKVAEKTGLYDVEKEHKTVKITPVSNL